MGSERGQVSQKDSHGPANTEKIAAQESTPSRAPCYFRGQGFSAFGATSPGDIPLTRNLLYLQRTVGNRAVIQGLQRKARLSQQQPAKAAGPLPFVPAPVGAKLTLQRKCACGGIADESNKCAGSEPNRNLWNAKPQVRLVNRCHRA